MKKIALVMLFSATLLVPALARADASQQGCESSDGKAKGCTKDPTTAPEPGIAILVGSGLLALAGFAALRRKIQPTKN
ncbi:MAG TPA: PEP-CTERM sorting domain-containing protein [Candidatus Acidoferrum sp.]|nr:PEP-CTERM sorting domain-containing protein [Candidatus Acidoferrum sp.]